MKSKGARLLGFSCMGIIFVFLVRELASNWAALEEYWGKLSLALALLSLGTMTGSLFLLPWGLREVLRLLGHPLPYKRICRILFTSLMAKYIPGGWWAFLGRAHLYSREGLPLTQASLAVLMETVLVVSSGIFVFAVFFTVPSFFSRAWRDLFFILLGAVCLALLHPRLLNYFLAAAAKLIKKKAFYPLQYSYGKITVPFFIFSLFWLCMGGGFWLLSGSLLGAAPSLFPKMIGAFALSWVIGFLSIITPAGLGVREGALTLLLQSSFPVYAAAALTLLSRVWWTGAEILALVFSVLWDRTYRQVDPVAPQRGDLSLGNPFPGRERNF